MRQNGSTSFIRFTKKIKNEGFIFYQENIKINPFFKNQTCLKAINIASFY